MQLAHTDATVSIAWPDGHRSTFHAVWLRDNCPCSECRHPSGQRLLDTRAIQDDVALGYVRSVDGSVEVGFGDGHASVFDADWLRAHCYCAGEQRRGRPRRLWDAAIAHELPTLRYADVSAGGDALRRWLAWVDELGFALLTGGPTKPGTVTEVAELFGYVRETNYGRLFDVRSVVSPTNLAFTGLGLGAHTDNPYRDPTPTLQLLHCLSSSAGGGENTLVDGFRVAADLPPADVELLARYPLRFRFADAEAELETEVPVLQLDACGELQAVHYNTRSAQPFRIPEDELAAYYGAYQRFGRMLEDARYRIRFKLEPGDLFIVDNLRVLHGRTGYSEAGERHLQGCYADRDGLRSKLAVLSRPRSGPSAQRTGGGGPGEPGGSPGRDKRRAEVIDEIFRVFREYGAEQYLGEPVSMTEHMLQSAHAAEQDGAPPALVAAALLHDYGHFIHELPEDAAQHGIDTRHEEVGHGFLSTHFGPEVVEPIRMHVAAKRYLCAVEPAYLAELSPASIHSLELQGGPYGPEEVREFERSPHARDAVRLRRYDDAGKVAGLETPDLEHYRPVLEAAMS